MLTDLRRSLIPRDPEAVIQHQLRLPKLGLQLSVLSLGCDIQLAPHFTVGNVLQLMAFVLMLPAMRFMGRNSTLLWMATLVGIGLSSVPLVALTNEAPQWIQIPYFALAATYVAQATAMAPYVDARTLLRRPVNLAAVFLALTALYQKSSGKGLLSLYFDDKSHAVIAAAALGFLVLWVNRSVWGLLLALLMCTVAAATASRIIVAGAPFLLIAVAVAYRQSRKRAATPLSVYLHHLTLLALPVLGWVMLRSSWSAYLFARLSSQDAAGQVAAESTQGHLQLALLALRLKLIDPFVTLLGVGPGGFPAGVRGFHVDATALSVADPTGYSDLMDGSSFVPIHSVTLTVLVEYPFWVALTFFGLWLGAMVKLGRQRDWIMLLMSSGLFVMTSLYSAHNEFFFWPAFVLPIIASVENGRQGEEPRDSTELSHHGDRNHPSRPLGSQRRRPALSSANGRGHVRGDPRRPFVQR